MSKQGGGHRHHKAGDDVAVPHNESQVHDDSDDELFKSRS